MPVFFSLEAPGSFSLTRSSCLSSPSQKLLSVFSHQKLLSFLSNITSPPLTLKLNTTHPQTVFLSGFLPPEGLTFFLLSCHMFVLIPLTYPSFSPSPTSLYPMKFHPACMCPILILPCFPPGLGIRSSVLRANHSFFAQKWANEQFAQKNERFAHDRSFPLSNLSESLMVAHFWWATWAICSNCSFVVSDLSNLLTLLTKIEGMSELLI